jgi:microsomal epoxide hydrolase
MNSFPNFMSTVALDKEDFKVHFVALFSSNPKAVPVALFHGWPGSSCSFPPSPQSYLFISHSSNNLKGNFLEFLPILSLMKKKYTPETLPYHLIVPSLPGYAFSDPPPLDHDFATKDISALMNQLMLDLGFESGYIAQGGDIGSRVAKILGASSDACKGTHSISFLPPIVCFDFGFGERAS